MNNSSIDFEKIIISNAEGTVTAEILPKLGALMTSLKFRGKEILYIDEQLIGTGNIRAGGFPILFPVCGRLNEGCYMMGGRKFEMPIHGFARNMQWSEGSAPAKANEAELFLESNEMTVQAYPFSFKACIIYKAVRNGILIQMKIQNESEVEMPVHTGYHPFFFVEKKYLQLDLKAKGYVDYNSGESKEYTNDVDFNGKIDYVLYDLLDSTHSFLNRKDRLKISLELDKKYKNIVLWTMHDRNFICIEPWSARPGALNTGEDLYILPPGESIFFSVKIATEEF